MLAGLVGIDFSRSLWFPQTETSSVDGVQRLVCQGTRCTRVGKYNANYNGALSVVSGLLGFAGGGGLLRVAVDKWDGVPPQEAVEAGLGLPGLVDHGDM